jgi:hypothetical protein
MFPSDDMVESSGSREAAGEPAQPGDLVKAADSCDIESEHGRRALGESATLDARSSSRHPSRQRGRNGQGFAVASNAPPTGGE